jgi:hypothetical protein
MLFNAYSNHHAAPQVYTTKTCDVTSKIVQLSYKLRKHLQKLRARIRKKLSGVEKFVFIKKRITETPTYK